MTVTSCMGAPSSPTTIFVKHIFLVGEPRVRRLRRRAGELPPAPVRAPGGRHRGHARPPRRVRARRSRASRSRCSTATAIPRSRPRASAQADAVAERLAARGPARAVRHHAAGAPPDRGAARRADRARAGGGARAARGLARRVGGRRVPHPHGRGRPGRAAGGRRGALGGDPGRGDDGVARRCACAPGSRRSSRTPAPTSRVAAIVHGGVIGEVCRQATDSRPFAFVHSDNGSLTRLVVLAGGALAAALVQRHRHTSRKVEADG